MYIVIDTNTFLTALYTVVDDLYKAYAAPLKPHRPGHKPELSDSEVITLTLLAQWIKRKERAMLRYAAEHWRAYFPRLLHQSAQNRRARDLTGVMLFLLPRVAAILGAVLAPYQILDGAPVRLMRCCRGKQHRLFGVEADIGRGGSDHEWYYGCQLLPAITADGVITGFVLGPAATEGHWLAEVLLCWRADPLATPWGPEQLPRRHRKGGQYVGPTGPVWPRQGVGMPSSGPYITDGGFFGKAWQTHWRLDYRAVVLTRQDYKGEEAEAAKRQHSGWRQMIETVNDALENVFGLSFPGARSVWGLLTRVVAKLLAFNLGIWLNRLFGRPDLALATLFSC